ncbi:alpha/beta hydrolase [Labrys neptuniae]|uniref:alpha/beta hydrolase n=1 Tax=Labrys neptuniae TaxID=376174 RepID=UPI002890A17C|nr:alpha/beta hydrolase [Labrys neptuniae]MDT3381123.1 alpha/beta hydrolase [Labrys neptuniae]
MSWNTSPCRRGAFALCFLGLFPLSGPALAQTAAIASGGETVTVAGIDNILIRHPHAKGSLILLTGGDGRLDVGPNGRFRSGADNVLIRNRDAFAAKGYNVLLVDKGTSLATAVDTMAGLKRPVTLVATSAGTPRAAEGLLKGARPDRLVLTSAFLSQDSGSSRSVMAMLGSPRLLPPTLVVHHRQDDCRFTRPAGVAPFQAWAGERVTVKWLEGGLQTGNPCRSRAHHGFNGQDAELVSLVTSFAGQ